MKDIDAIVERFMEAEDANFSLFNYVNEVNAEVEKLEEQIAEIKVQTDLPQSHDTMYRYSMAEYTTALLGIMCQYLTSINISTFWQVASVFLPASTSVSSGMLRQHQHQCLLECCVIILGSIHSSTFWWVVSLSLTAFTAAPLK